MTLDDFVQTQCDLHLSLPCSHFLALKLPLGRTTVMHLVARETLPEPNSQGNQLSFFPPLRSLFTSWKTLNVQLPATIIYFYSWLQFQEQPLVQIISSFRCFPKTQHTVQNVELEAKSQWTTGFLFLTALILTVDYKSLFCYACWRTFLQREI